MRLITTRSVATGTLFSERRKTVPHVITTATKAENAQQGIAMEIDPNKAIRYIQEKAPVFAQVKANRVFIENYLRTSLTPNGR